MMGKLNERGITLIALVVTIIILLILACVTLNIALSDNGLIKKAQDATEKYKQAQNKEEESISEITKLLYSDYVGAKVTGYEPEEITIESNDDLLGENKTGANDNTDFATENLGWKIWDYDGTTLRLISEKPTTTTLTLSGEAGYNNGVYIINEICRRCYTDKNVKGVEVRNLRRSDIEKVSNYDYTKYKHQQSKWSEVIEDNNDLVHFGEIVNAEKYGDNKQYPEIWTNFDSKWNYKYDKTTKKGIGDSSCKIPWEQESKSEIEEGKDSTNKIEFKESYYEHIYNENEFNNSKYYDLIYTKSDNIGTRDCWLAGRYTYLDEEYCSFGIHSTSFRSVQEDRLMCGYILFNSNRGFLS